MAVLVAALAGPALAGPKSGATSSTSSIWIASVNDASFAARSTDVPMLALGDNIDFGTIAAGLAGPEYPMVGTSCYQDVNGDLKVDTTINGPDVVFTDLMQPSETHLLGGASSIWTLRGGGGAVCRADLIAIGWKSGRQSARILATMPFYAV